MDRKLVALIGLAAGLLSPAWAQSAAPTGPQPLPPNFTNPASGPAPTSAPAAPGQKYIVPAGTKVLLTMKSALNTRTARPGDGVYLVSSFPVIVDSHVLIPDGAYVQGVVDRVQRPGRVKGRAEISMHFTQIIFPNGQVVQIPGSLNSLPGSDGPKVKGNEGTVEQSSSVGQDGKNVLTGAGFGTMAGAMSGVAGGSALAGMAYGGAAGAAAGGVYSLLTRGKDITIPEGSPVEMVFERPLALEAQQFATVNEQPPPPQQQFVPLQPQPPPLQKPAAH